MTGLSPTERALLRLCRLRADAADHDLVRRLAPETEWSDLVRLAAQGGVAGLVARNLEGHDLPREARLSLGHAALLGQARTQPLLDLGRRLCAAALDQGLTLVPLKGTALHLMGVYDDPGLRAQIDLDLLVRREDIGAVDRLARQAGLEEDASHRDYSLRHSHHLVYRRPGPPPTLLELHWTGLLAQYADRSVEREILGRCRRADVQGTPLLLPAPADLALLLILHFCVHRFRAQLKWLVDIAELARFFGDGLDWGQVYELARRVGALRATALAVERARALLDAPIPPPDRRPPLLPALDRLAPVSALVQSAPQPPWRARALVDLLAYDSPWHGARFLLHKGVELVERYSGLRLPSPSAQRGA